MTSSHRTAAGPGLGRPIASKWRHWSEFELPWGMLPFLRPGQRYANGYVLDGEFVGERRQISLSGTPHLEPADTVLPAGFFPGGREDHGEELCLVFDPPATGGTPRVVLPVIKAIRALRVPNKTLAYGLFNPGFLDGIVMANDLQGECLHLDFNAQIPLRALSPPVVGRLPASSMTPPSAGPGTT